MQRHRLALLLGVLVALVFFYLGINTWMESQRMKAAPPPVVRAKPPVQTTPQTEPLKPVEPVVLRNPEPVSQNSPGEERAEGNPEEEEIKEPKEEPKEEKPKRKGDLKDFVFQIGAFKKKENAQKRLQRAKESGFDAFLIEEEGLYKVRVRVKAEDLKGAISKVRKSFKSAFVVR
jgi:DedD protein